MNDQFIIPSASSTPIYLFNFESEKDFHENSSKLLCLLLDLQENNNFSLELEFSLILNFSLEFIDLNSVSNLNCFLQILRLLFKNETLINKNIIFTCLETKKITNLSLDLTEIINEGETIEKFNNLMKNQPKLKDLKLILNKNDIKSINSLFLEIENSFKKLNSLTLILENENIIDFTDFSKYLFPNLFLLQELTLEVKNVNLNFENLGKLPIKKLNLSLNIELKKNFIDEFSLDNFKNLNSLSLNFEKTLIESEFLEYILLNQLNKLDHFSIGFQDITSGISEISIKIFEILNNSILKLKSFGFKAVDAVKNHEETLNNLLNSIEKLKNLKSLEINIMKNNINGTLLSEFIGKLMEIKGSILEKFWIFLGFNNMNDITGTELLKSFEKLTNIEYFLMDLSQSYSSSTYLNAGLSQNIIDLIKKLSNLHGILINLEGNEIKEMNYNSIEIELSNLKKEFGKLEFYKIMRKNEIFTDVNNANFINFNYYKEFEKCLCNISNENFCHKVSINNIEIKFNECFFKSEENCVEFMNLFKIIRDLNVHNINFYGLNPDIKNNLYKPILNFFSEDKKNIFNKKYYEFSFIFNEKNEYLSLHPIILEKNQDFSELANNLSSKKIHKLIKLLPYIDNIKVNEILEDEKALENMLKNRLFLSLLSPSNFSTIYLALENNEKILQNFICMSFISNILINIPSELPSLILENEKYSKFLTPDIFFLFLEYSKEIKNCFPNTNLSKSQQTIHINKIKSITSLNLSKNKCFSFHSWRDFFVKKINKTYNQSKIFTINEIYNNKFFIKKSTEKKVFETENNFLDSQISKILKEMEDKLLELEFPLIEKYYIDFFKELISYLPNLETVLIKGIELNELEFIKNKKISKTEKESLKNVVYDEEKGINDIWIDEMEEEKIKEENEKISLLKMSSMSKPLKKDEADLGCQPMKPFYQDNKGNSLYNIVGSDEEDQNEDYELFN